MFKFILVTALVATVYAQQIGTTTNCATCQYWGGNWCQTGSTAALTNSCWRRANATLTGCTNYIKSPSSCPSAVACSTVWTDGDQMGTVWIQYFLTTNQFCVANVTNNGNQALDVNLYATRAGWNVARAENSSWISQVNITDTTSLPVEAGASAFYLFQYTGTGLDSIWLETTGTYVEPTCPSSAVFMKFAVAAMAVVVAALNF